MHVSLPENRLLLTKEMKYVDEQHAISLIYNNIEYLPRLSFERVRYKVRG